MAPPGPPPPGPPPTISSQAGKKSSGRNGRDRGSTLKPQLPEPTQHDAKLKNKTNVPLSSSKFNALQKLTPSKVSSSDGSSHLATPRSIINKSAPRSLKEILEQKAEEKKQDEIDEEEAKLELDKEEEAFKKFEAQDIEPYKPQLLERARCQGYLSKQGSHWNVWKRRWFVMRLTSLDFYKRRIKIPDEYQGMNEEDAEARARSKHKAQGSIKLGSVVRIQRDLVKYPQPFCFQLVCTDGTFAVQADTKSDMELWIDEINDAIRAIKLGLGSTDGSFGGKVSSKLNRRTTVSGNIGNDNNSFNSTLSISESFKAVRQMSPLVNSKAKSMAMATANISENKVTNIYGLEQKSDGKEVSPKTFSPKRASPSFSRRMTAPSGIFSPGTATTGGNTIQQTSKASVKAMEKVIENETRRKSLLLEKKDQKDEKVVDLVDVVDEDSAPLFLHKDPPNIKINLERDVGKSLLQKMQDGNVEMCYTSDTLAKSTRVGLYFGAQWCDPCRAFLPRLVDFYTRLRLDGRNVEILFVSNDAHNNDFKDYYVYNMPWLAIPFDEDVRRFKLAEKLGVSKVPSLVFLDGNGHVLTTEGLDMVFNDKDGSLLFRMRSRDKQSHQNDAKEAVDNNNTYGSPTALTLHSQHQSAGSGNIHDWRESDITGIVNTPSPSRSVRNRAHTNINGPGEISLPTLPMVPANGNNMSPNQRMVAMDASSIQGGTNTISPSDGNRSGRKRTKRSPAYRRKLLHEKQRRYKMTPRVLAQFIRWLDTLQVWPAPVTDLYRELRSGVMLCRIVQVLVPDADFKGINRKPRTMRPAVNNIEKALSVIWQRGRPNARRMPTAEEIFEGRSERIGWLIRELFQCFVMRPMRSKSRCSSMMMWYQEILSAYGRQVSDRVLEAPYRGEAFGKALWKAFHDGVNLACIMHYFCGNKEVEGFSGVDLTLMYSEPKQTEQFESNVAYVFELLSQLGVPLVWTVADFIAFPDESFLLWQIHAVYLALNGLKCALPEIPYGQKYMEEAVTVTELGAPVVINLKFRSEEQSASFASPLSQRSDDPLGLRSTFEKVKPEPEEVWNASTLSPDLTRREKGANVVWSHPQETGGDNDVDAGNFSLQQEQQRIRNQFGQGQYNTVRNGSHNNSGMDTKATAFLKKEIENLEDEKMSLLEAEKFAHENPPTSVIEVQNAIQLKERRLMVQEEQRALLSMLQSPATIEHSENLDMNAKYSASLQQQHHQIHTMDAEATARSNGSDPVIVENNGFPSHTQEAPKALEIEIGNEEENSIVGHKSTESRNSDALSPTSKFDFDLQRRTALEFLRDGHLVDIAYSNGSSQEKQTFKAVEDKSGSTVFVWEGPQDDGRLGYLPLNLIESIDTDEKGAIVLNVYDDQKNLHRLFLSTPDAPAEQLKLLANLSIIIS